MADQDDVSKPTRGRRNPFKSAAKALSAAAAADSEPSRDLTSALLTAPPPRTLEEAIANTRALLLEVRAMAHCLSEVLLYADDVDTMMHAEVAQMVARGIGEAAAQMDLTKLRPLIDAVRRGGSSSDGLRGGPSTYPYNIREATPVYRA